MANSILLQWDLVEIIRDNKNLEVKNAFEKVKGFQSIYTVVDLKKSKKQKSLAGKGVERRKGKEERKKGKKQIASHITLEIPESQPGTG